MLVLVVMMIMTDCAHLPLTLCDDAGFFFFFFFFGTLLFSSAAAGSLISILRASAQSSQTQVMSFTCSSKRREKRSKGGQTG